MSDEREPEKQMPLPCPFCDDGHGVDVPLAPYLSPAALLEGWNLYESRYADRFDQANAWDCWVDRYGLILLNLARRCAKFEALESYQRASRLEDYWKEFARDYNDHSTEQLARAERAVAVAREALLSPLDHFSESNSSRRGLSHSKKTSRISSSEYDSPIENAACSRSTSQTPAASQASRINSQKSFIFGGRRRNHGSCHLVDDVYRLAISGPFYSGKWSSGLRRASRATATALSARANCSVE